MWSYKDTKSPNALGPPLTTLRRLLLFRKKWPRKDPIIKMGLSLIFFSSPLKLRFFFWHKQRRFETVYSNFIWGAIYGLNRQPNNPNLLLSSQISLIDEQTIRASSLQQLPTTSRLQIQHTGKIYIYIYIFYSFIE